MSRRKRGEDHPKARLSDEDVRQMRKDYLAYVVGYETLAKRWNCGVSTARDIITMRTRFA